MAAVIKPEDLYDEEGFKQSFRELDKSHSVLHKSMQGLLKSTRKEYADLIKELSALGAKGLTINLNTAGAAEKIRAIHDEIDKTGEAFDYAKARIVSINKAFESNASFIEGAKKAVNSLQSEIRMLNYSNENERASIIRLNKELGTWQSSIKAVTAAQKAGVAVAREVQGSYGDLNRRTNDLRRELKDLPNAFNLSTGAINKSNKAAVDLQQQILRNTNALKAMDAQMGVHTRNVGNYKSGLEGLTSSFKGLGAGIVSLATSVVGISSAVDAIMSTGQVIATLERQHMALRNASSSATEYDRNMRRLVRVVSDTGAPLEETNDALRKFTGATKGTAIEGEKARFIFGAFTKTFASNGASSEELTRAMKALSDMMSKGTVQAEELKGQLGDAMPGALKLFADAMGVSQRELLKMMQNGELLAEDVLPKVAARLELITGDRAKANLKTISGSWQDFKNQISLLLDVLNEKGGASSGISWVNNRLSAFIQMARMSIDARGTVGGLLYMLLNPVNATKEAIFTIRQQEKFDTFSGDTKAGQENRLAQQSAAVATHQAKVNELLSERARLTKATSSVFSADYVTNKKQLNVVNEQLALEQKRLLYLTNGLEKYKKIYAETEKSRDFLNKPVKGDTPDKIIANIRKEIDKIPQHAIDEKTGKAFITKDQAKNLRGMRDEVAALFNTLTKAEVAQLKLAGLRDELNELLSGKPKEKQGGSTKQETEPISAFEYQIKQIDKLIKAGLAELQKNGKIPPEILKSLQTYEGLLNRVAASNSRAASKAKELQAILKNPVALVDTPGSAKNVRSFEEIVRQLVNGEAKGSKTNMQLDNLFNEMSREMLVNYNLRIEALTKLNRKYIDGASFLRKGELDALKKHLTEVLRLEEKARNTKAQKDKDAAELARKNFENELASMQSLAAKRQRLIEDTLTFAGEIGNAISQISQQNRDAELEALQKQKDYELSIVGENKEAQDRINKEYARREAEIRQRQAKADKENALFQIAINTAIGVTRAAGSAFWWEIPMIIATGAIQAAVVLSKPLPQFFKGTEYSPEGFAQVAEYGPEAITSPKGETKIIEKPSIVYLEKGSKVKTASQTKAMFRQLEQGANLREMERGAARLDTINQLTRENRERELRIAVAGSGLTEEGIGRAFAKALDDRPEKGMIYDEKGIRSYEKRRGMLTDYANKKNGF